MIKLKELPIVESIDQLKTLPQGKLLINTINAHSYNTALKDSLFAEALIKGDVLIPDGASVVKICKWLKMQSQPRERIAGWDLFVFEMNRLNEKGGRCMFMGSSEKVLALIKQRAAVDYPNLEIVTYSPPYKPEFSQEDNAAIVAAINEANPDLLWIGMTAPKQEKWIYENIRLVGAKVAIGVGGSFDVMAGNVKRAPKIFRRLGLEWFHRLITQPTRWRRMMRLPKFALTVLRTRGR